MHYFTRRSPWEKSAQKLWKYQETSIWKTLRYPRGRRRTNRNSRNSNLPTDTSGGSRGGGGRIGRGPPLFWPIFVIFGRGIEEFGIPGTPLFTDPGSRLWTLLHRDWPASPVSRPAICPARPICMYTGAPTTHTLYVHCNTHTHTHSTPRCVRYSDKLPMKITCNCWNNSLWNHLSARPGKQNVSRFTRNYFATNSSHDQGFWKLTPLLNYTSLTWSYN